MNSSKLLSLGITAVAVTALALGIPLTAASADGGPTVCHPTGGGWLAITPDAADYGAHVAHGDPAEPVDSSTDTFLGCNALGGAPAPHSTDQPDGVTGTHEGGTPAAPPAPHPAAPHPAAPHPAAPAAPHPQTLSPHAPAAPHPQSHPQGPQSHPQGHPAPQSGSTTSGTTRTAPSTPQGATQATTGTAPAPDTATSGTGTPAGTHAARTAPRATAAAPLAAGKHRKLSALPDTGIDDTWTRVTGLGLDAIGVGLLVLVATRRRTHA